MTTSIPEPLFVSFNFLFIFHLIEIFRIEGDDSWKSALKLPPTDTRIKTDV